MLVLIPLVTVGLILVISGAYVAYVSRVERRGGRMVISKRERSFLPIGVGFVIGSSGWAWVCHSVQSPPGSGKVVEMPLTTYWLGVIAFWAAGVFLAERLVVPLFGRWSRRYREKRREKLALAREPEIV